MAWLWSHHHYGQRKDVEKNESETFCHVAMKLLCTCTSAIQEFLLLSTIVIKINILVKCYEDENNLQLNHKKNQIQWTVHGTAFNLIHKKTAKMNLFYSISNKAQIWREKGCVLGRRSYHCHNPLPHKQTNKQTTRTHTHSQTNICTHSQTNTHTHNEETIGSHVMNI